MNQSPKTNPQNRITTVAVLVGLALGLALVCFLPRLSPLRLLALLLVFLLSMAVALVLQLLLHEMGHCLLGLLTGYRLVSFRLGNRLFLREGGRWRCAQFRLPGTAGQCLMAPPDREPFPCALYNLGGILLNLLSALTALALWFCLPRSHWSAIPLWTFLATGVAFALANAVPRLDQGVANDGYNQRCLRRDPGSREAFRNTLRIHARLAQGDRLRDMPDAWFRLPENADQASPLVCGLAVQALSRQLDLQQLTGARAACDRLLQAPGLLGLHRSLVQGELLYLELLGPRRRDWIDALFTPELRSFLERLQGTNPTALRLLYAHALLAAEDEEAANRYLEAFQALGERYPYRGDYAQEQELVALAQRAFAGVGPTG